MWTVDTEEIFLIFKLEGGTRHLKAKMTFWWLAVSIWEEWRVIILKFIFQKNGQRVGLLHPESFSCIQYEHDTLAGASKYKSCTKLEGWHDSTIIGTINKLHPETNCSALWSTCLRASDTDFTKETQIHPLLLCVVCSYCFIDLETVNKAA